MLQASNYPHLTGGKIAQTPRIHTDVFNSEHYIEKSGRHQHNQVIKVNTTTNKKYTSHTPRCDVPRRTPHLCGIPLPNNMTTPLSNHKKTNWSVFYKKNWQVLFKVSRLGKITTDWGRSKIKAVWNPALRLVEKKKVIRC